MLSICLYLQVHQPLRIKKYRIFNIGNDHEYFNDTSETNLNNEKILKKVAEKSYLPTNELLLELLNKHKEFKISFSLSGVLLEQLMLYSPQTLLSFQRLVKTGRVELLNETYYHSLSFLYDQDEFRRQINLHRKIIKQLFNLYPKVFRNTELIYNNELAKEVEEMGFKVVLTEGADHILGWRNPNFVYQPQNCSKIKLLLKNYKLSDDIAFRFSQESWEEYPLTASKFGQWVSAINGYGKIINLFMDYETFGEHQWASTGIFDFLKSLPSELLKNPDINFVTPSEVVSLYEPVAKLDIPNFISWADTERDLSAWLSNHMQKDAIKKLYDLSPLIKSSKDQKLINDWGRLQTSDHFYYMCTKWFSDGDVHKYFNPYESPYDAYICFMNVLKDLTLRIKYKKHLMDPSKDDNLINEKKGGINIL